MNRPESKLKDKAWEEYINHVEQEIQKLKSSPYYDSYQTLRDQITSWNSQLKITGERKERTLGYDKEGNPITETYQQGYIDIFADKDSKEFERAIKYFDQIENLLTKLDSIKLKMNPEDRRQMEEDEKMRSVTGAEKFLAKK